MKEGILCVAFTQQVITVANTCECTRQLAVSNIK